MEVTLTANTAPSRKSFSQRLRTAVLTLGAPLALLMLLPLVAGLVEEGVSFLKSAEDFRSPNYLHDHYLLKSISYYFGLFTLYSLFPLGLLCVPSFIFVMADNLGSKVGFKRHFVPELLTSISLALLGSILLIGYFLDWLPYGWPNSTIEWIFVLFLSTLFTGLSVGGIICGVRSYRSLKKSWNNANKASLKQSRDHAPLRADQQ